MQKNGNKGQFNDSFCDFIGVNHRFGFAHQSNHGCIEVDMDVSGAWITESRDHLQSSNNDDPVDHGWHALDLKYHLY
jgi:hypothetical protein